MASYMRIVLCLAVGSAILAGASAEEPKAKAKANIEFRWLEDKPVKGLTEAKGIRCTCGNELWYPHAKPVLTNKEVAEARLQKHDFSRNGLPGDHFTVHLHLTAKAKKTLVAACGNAPERTLVLFIDGRYWGTSRFQKSMVAGFVPTAGGITSRGEADRIVEACE